MVVVVVWWGGVMYVLIIGNRFIKVGNFGPVIVSL